MIKIPGEQVAAAYAKLSLDAAEFLSGLNSAESRFKSFASNVESTGSKLGAVLSTLGKGMVAGIAAAGTATLGGVKAFADFEKGLASVSKTTGMTGKDLEALGESLRDLARQGPVTVTELEKIAATAGSLGVGAQKMAAGDIAGARAEIMDFTKTISDMAVAFDMTADAVAPMVASIANVYKLPTNELALFGSQVNALENSMNATAPQILEFVNAFGGTAAMFGESASKTAAFGAVLNSLGITGAEAATQLRSGILQLLQSYEVSESAVKKYAKEHNVSMEQAREALKINQKNVEKLAQVMGVSADEIRRRLNEDLYGSLVWIGTKLKDIQGETEAAAIVSQIFGVYGYQAMMKLGASAETYDFALKQINTDSKGLMREADVMANTISGQWRRLKNNIYDVGIEIGKSVQGPAQDFLRFMNDKLIPGVREFLKALVSGDWAGAFTSLKNIASTTWESIKSSAAAVWDYIKNLDYKTIWDNIKGLALEAWDGIKSAASSIYDALKNADWGGLGRTAADKLKTAFEVLKDVGDRLKNSISNVDWAGIGGAAAEKVRAGFDALRDIGNKIKTYVDSVNWSDVGNKAATRIRQGMDTLKDLGDRIKNFIESVNWNSVGGSLGQKLREGFEKLATLHETLQNSLKRWADDPGGAYATGQAIGRALRDAALAAWDAVKWAADLMRQIVYGIESKKAEYGGSIVRAIIGEAREWLDAAATAGKNLLSGILSELSPLGAMLRNAIIDAVSGAVEGLPVVGSDFARKLREWKVEVPTVQRPSGAGMPSTTESGASGSTYTRSTYTPSTWTSTSTPAAAFTSLRQPETHTYGELTAAAGTVARTGYYTIEFLYKGKVYKSTADVIKAMASEGKTEAEIAESLYYATEPLKSEEYTSYVLRKEDTRDLQKVLTTIYKTVPISLLSSERELEKARALGAYQLGVQEYEKQKAAANAALEASEKVEDVSSDVEKAAEKSEEAAEKSEEAAKQTTEANKSSQTAAIDVNKLIEAFRQKTYSAGESVTGAAQYAATSLKLGAEVAKKFTTDAGQAVVISFDTATNTFKANIGSAGTALKQTGDYNLMKAQEMGAVITNSGTSTSSNIGLGGLRAQTSMQTGGQVAQTHIQAGGQAAQSALVTGANTIYSRIASIPDIGVKIATAADYFASKVVSAAISAASAISRAVSGRSIGGALGTPIRYAEGGVVTRPVLGMVGEAGAEAIIPLDNKAAGWKILSKILPLFGIRPFAEGGIIGAAEGSTGSETISASFQISYLDQAAAVFGSKLRYMLNYFRKTMNLIRLDSIKKWRDIIDSSTKVWNEFITSVSQKSIEFRMVVGKAFYDTATSLIATITAASIELSGRFDLMMTSFKESSQSTFNMLNSMFESFKNDILPAFINGWQSSLNTMVEMFSSTVTKITGFIQQIANALTQLTGRTYNINIGSTGGIGGGGGGGGGYGTVSYSGGSQLFAEQAFMEVGGICQVDAYGMTPGLAESLILSGVLKPNENPLSQKLYQQALANINAASQQLTGSNIVERTKVTQYSSSWLPSKSSFVSTAQQRAASAWSSSVTPTSGGGVRIGSTTTRSVIKLGKYQHGGLALTPQLAMIAENGPEMVIPVKYLSGGENKIEVNVYLDGKKISSNLFKHATNVLKTRGLKL